MVAWNRRGGGGGERREGRESESPHSVVVVVVLQREDWDLVFGATFEIRFINRYYVFGISFPYIRPLFEACE